MKILFIFIISINILIAKDYTYNQNAIQFINMMTTQYNYKPSYLKKLFSNITKQSIPLNIITGIPVENTIKKKTPYIPTGAWDRYVKYKVTPTRVSQGVSFIKKNKSVFNSVENTYGVPIEYIAAILGIESVYGGNTGKFPVLDTLVTLAFENNRRNKFFQSELREFIRLAYKYKFNPKNVKGSYTGAIGLSQFMPSNYDPYGIDFNNDGKVSLQHPHDAIASVANYLKLNGWKHGEEVATRVTYKGTRFTKYKTGYNRKYNRNELIGISPKFKYWSYNKEVRLIKLSKLKYDELWYGAKNFYVITRYNHSAYYAMSVHKLAQQIKLNL